MSNHIGEAKAGAPGGLKMTRRSFLAGASALAAGILVHGCGETFDHLAPADGSNPLAGYPDRGWEKVYRDLFREDSHFHFLCAPNDTHNCLLKAHVKNGVVTRIGPSYRYGEATDLYGHKSSHRWEPRCCQKGLALVRRYYGDRRVKGATVRRGFKAWADAGFPRDADGRAPAEYMRRGEDTFVRVPWEEAFDLSAKALENIATAYSGEEGGRRLLAQGYEPETVEATGGAGVQTLKFRGGMALLGAIRIFGYYRFANMLALLDAKVRGVGPDKAVGARGWDSYSWHTDLPPGHPMVTGNQTNDFDLACVEYAKLITIWGMNWVTTKMPDAHWLTEAKLKGARVVNVSVEYPATGARSDDILVIRPGTDAALALGMCQVILAEKLHDVDFVKRFTDLPYLVRMDTLEMLKCADVVAGHKNSVPSNYVTILPEGTKAAAPIEHDRQVIPEKLAAEWGDLMVIDAATGKVVPAPRDEFGKAFRTDPRLEGGCEVTLLDGKKVEVRPVFDLLKQYLDDSFPPELASGLTWAKAEAIRSIAREIAANRGKTLFVTGMGPNHFFNNDLKDRAIFLLASLTGNLGHEGGNVGSYAGNYKTAIIGGLPAYVVEDPFDLELDPAKKSHKKYYLKYESAHFYNYGDRPLKVGGRLFQGKGHMNTPTKAMMLNNSNSIIGNVKWHYDVVTNTLPRIEFITVADYWWTKTCEYADIVYGCDCPMEFKKLDFTASCSNPFLQVYPVTPLPRLHDTLPDADILAGVAGALAKRTGDGRFADHWKFIREDRTDVYARRILSESGALAGFTIEELEARAKEGIPALVNNRTYPRVPSWEQVHENKPWYTKSGRLEFYRHEREWIEHGENLPVFREPVDSTFHEPNVIVAKPHPAVRPKSPEEFGFPSSDLSTETRQVRNVVRTPEEVGSSVHPLAIDGFKFIFLTPKFRHATHTTPADTDKIAVWFGPFGDVYRRDRRLPFVTEGYVDMNPDDAKALGIEDGDYVHVDSDPNDRPFRGYKPGGPGAKVARLLCRARYYYGLPRGVTRMWFNQFGATPGSVRGHEGRADGLAKNPDTGYQAMFRYGSHQSGTRAWLRPTLLTDSLVRKDGFGQTIGKGFHADIHCAAGAPKESVVKIAKAEDGGLDGRGPWRPVLKRLRPTHESPAILDYFAGRFIVIKA